MNVVIRDTINNTIVSDTKYPRRDISEPIAGLPEGHQVFIRVYDDKPDFDSRTHTLSTSEIWTSDSFEFHDHIKICQVSYTLVRRSDEEIISELNAALGNHLDTLCPLWKRTKYQSEALYILNDEVAGLTISSEDQQRKSKLMSVQEWFNACRSERDEMEQELVNNGVIPDFNFSPYPNL